MWRGRPARECQHRVKIRGRGRPRHTCISSEVLQEFSCLVVESRKHLIQSMVSQMPLNRFAEHAAEICGDRQISSFIKL